MCPRACFSFYYSFSFFLWSSCRLECSTRAHFNVRACVRASVCIFSFPCRSLKDSSLFPKSERKKSNYVKNSSFTHLQKKIFNVFQSHAHTYPSTHTRREYIHNSIQIRFSSFSDKLFSFCFRFFFAFVIFFFSIMFVISLANTLLMKFVLF